MKIPETLKVGPFPYRVERLALVNKERRDRVGEADNANLVIRIVGLYTVLKENNLLRDG
jgi:hypothetical protein